MKSWSQVHAPSETALVVVKTFFFRRVGNTVVIISVNRPEYILISSAGGRNGGSKTNLQSHVVQHYKAHSVEMVHSPW